MAGYKREVAYAPWSERKTATYQSVSSAVKGKYVDGYGRFGFYLRTHLSNAPRPIVFYEEDGKVSYMTYDDYGDNPVLIYRLSEV